MTRRPDVVEALAAKHLLPFLMLVYQQLVSADDPLKPSWYLRAICYLLERATRGEVRRYMIWLMPRTLKSLTMAVAWPCWLMGQNPKLSVMVAAYSDDLSRTHAENRQLVMNSSWYKRIFPKTVVRVDRRLELRTTAGGWCRGVSVGGTITGKGTNFIILDDVMKPVDAESEAGRLAVKRWLDGTMVTRFDDPGKGVIISMQQRLHEDDLPAYLLTKGYELLRLPAVADRDERIPIGPGRVYHWKRGEPLDPDRFPLEVLAEKRFEQGPQLYSAQYLQDPVAPEGNLFKMEQFRRFEQPIHRERFEKVIQSWDTSQGDQPTNDWTVGLTWGVLAGRMFLLDIYRGRPSFLALREMIIAMRKQWRADYVLIERANMGYDLCREFRRSGPFIPRGITPTLDKERRANGQTGQIEQGRVFLPASLPGLHEFLSEVRAFPNGTKDDQVDAMVQALEFANLNWKTLAQQRTETGRIKAIVRGERPPLGRLPDWII